jgi:hypothetical protein
MYKQNEIFYIVLIKIRHSVVLNRIKSIVIGHMNSDPYRENKFDKIFLEFVNKKRL